MLDVSRIVFHLLGLDHELLLLLLRAGDLSFEIFLLLLQPMGFLQDWHEEKHETGEDDDARDRLRDMDKRGPNISATLSFERNAGRIKKASAGPGWVAALFERTSKNGVVTKFFLDAQQLVVLGEAIRAGE